ncbi:MAG: hypothetical protein IT276_12860 [Ignavibacteriaceae bacterium]|nr:hypothetical protein [Ignavibacteriaceae bacterium]HRN28024.1 DUF5677 domain-containing protein [Ignavibacteriaceae bacterium]HRP93837.1 DUF5677 domain-containing protein [Ignavibacteriaceae bacterium]
MDKFFYYKLRDDFELSSHEFIIILNDYEELIDVLSLLTQELYVSKVRDENWRYYIETISIKFIFHSLNLVTVFKGIKHFSKLLSIDNNLFDLSTGYILKRTLIENYLIFNYLFIQPKDKEEQRFRWLVFEIGGYSDRQGYSPILKELKDKLVTEQKIILDRIEELKTNKYFLMLEEKRRNSILKDKYPKLWGWKKIAKDSEINDEIFIKEWKLYSNYAHSEFISLMQIQDYYKDKEKLFNTRSHLLFSTVILTASFITDIIKTFQVINEKFDSLDYSQKDCIRFLSSIAKNKHNF